MPRSQVPQGARPSEQAGIDLGGAGITAPIGGTQGPISGNPVLDAVLVGVQQLQTLLAQAFKEKRDDNPEVVKPGITTLPKLAVPNPASGSLEFQDWLDLVRGLMSDLSDSSTLWWSSVMQLAGHAYAQWSVSSPLDRLQAAPSTTALWVIDPPSLLG